MLLCCIMPSAKESMPYQMYPPQNLTSGKHHEHSARGQPLAEQGDYRDLPAHDRGDRFSGTVAEWRRSTESRSALPRPSNDDHKAGGFGAPPHPQHVPSSYGVPPPPEVEGTVDRQPSFHHPPIIPPTPTSAAPQNRRKSPERAQGRELICSLRCSCCVRTD